MKMIDTIKAFAGKTAWTLKKNKPEILLVSGIVLTIGAVATACRATIKATDAVEEFNKQMNAVDQCVKAGKTAKGEAYTEEDEKKDRLTIKVQSGLKVAKCFILPAGLTAGAIACQIAGYKEMSKRLLLAGAAYAALSDKFKKYRAYICKNVSEDMDYKAFHGIKAVSGTYDWGEQKTDENGNVITKNHHEVLVADDDDYSVLFDERSEYWEPDFLQNLNFLKAEQSHWNKILKEFYPGRPVFLNDIRKRLGLPPTELGQVVGWVYAPDDPDHNGDNEINFGIDRLIEAVRKGEEMPYDRAILLDFNVDGNVLYAVKRKGVA